MNTVTDKLAHKKRSVKDLVRFIKTKSGNLSNFALLLGAGCSITSGVRSATELSEIWAREIYESYDGDPKDNLGRIRDYFKQNYSDWYNPNHEYSSLFEKRYDLPAQRRAFVEEEVAGKFPSLGYAYLIRLIENRYFNTIFTTNFDDLINESFHLFADSNLSDDESVRDLMRPIVCAHDSSVKSISVTSVRPKIIKLHGDFLFDDIKSTLRETESLEENIRNKFVEFCKEFGLIAVGYAGNDRSVMDVINYLLKSDDYLKNGLYWCVRKGDPISDELHKLLWKDRVYYVEIDGFDELFAELYEEVSLEKRSLPLPQDLPNKNNIIIERLVSNSTLLNSSSDIIKNVIEKLQNEKKKNSFFSSVREVLFPEGKIDDFQGLSSDETFELFEIDRLRTAKRYDEALIRVKSNISNPDYSFSFKNRLKHIAANILKRQSKFEEALKYCDEIIADSMNNPEEYLFKNNFLKKHEDRIENLRECIKKHPFFSRIYEQIVHYEKELLSHNFNDRTTLLTQLIEDLENGIKCNPAMDNDCYSAKFSLLLSKRKEYSENWYREALNICQNAESQNPEHPLVFDFKRQLITNDPHCSSDKKKEMLLELWDKSIQKLDDNFDIYIGTCLQLLDETIVSAEKIDSVTKYIEKNENRLKGKIRFARMFADFYARRSGNITKALQLWSSIPEDDYDFEILDSLKSCYSILKKKTEFEALLLRVKDNFNTKGQLRIDLMIAESQEDYVKALDILKKLQADQAYDYEYFTQEMYVNLCIENFEEVFTRSNDMLQDITSNEDRSYCDLINYEIARKEIKNRKVRDDKLEHIINSNASVPLKVAAYLLLDRDGEAKNFIIDDIKYDFFAVAQYLNTFVFKRYLDDETKRKLEDKLTKVV